MNLTRGTSVREATTRLRKQNALSQNFVFTCHLKQDNKVSLRHFGGNVYESFSGLCPLQKMTPSPLRLIPI
jgi:hypothetical protein